MSCSILCWVYFKQLAYIQHRKLLPCLIHRDSRHDPIIFSDTELNFVVLCIVFSVISRLITMISAQAELEERANNQPIPEPAPPVSSPPAQSYSSLIIIAVYMCPVFTAPTFYDEKVYYKYQIAKWTLLFTLVKITEKKTQSSSLDWNSFCTMS